MPGEIPQRWMPRTAGIFESIKWNFTASDLEKENAILAAQLGMQIQRESTLSMGTLEINLRGNQLVRRSEDYRRAVRYLATKASESEQQILQGEGVIDFLAATMVFSSREGGPAGMNDAFEFFQQEHAEVVLQRFPKLRGMEPRAFFNKCLDAYFGAIPKYVVELAEAIKVG